MSYKDTILEVAGIKEVGAGNYIILPALCDVDRKSEAKVTHASGKREPYNTFPGKAELTGSIKDFVLGVETADVLDLILSDAVTGKLKNIEIDDGDSRYTGHLTSLKISVPMMDAVTCGIDFTAKSKEVSSLIKTEQTIDAYIGQGVVLTGFPSNIDFESVEITVTNSVTAKHSARGSSRLPAHLAAGYLDISVNIKFNEDPNIDVTGTLSKISTATVVLKSISGATLTITLTGLMVSGNKRGMNEADIVDFGLDYVATGISFSAT